MHEEAVRVQRLFDEYLAKQGAGLQPSALSTAKSPDFGDTARRHAQEVAEREFAYREDRCSEVQRQIDELGSAEALYRGQIIPLPESGWLDHILCDPDVELETALAVMHKERLKSRVAILKRAFVAGNFAEVMPVVKAQAPDSGHSQRSQLARMLLKAEIEALEGLVESATDTALPEPAKTDDRLLARNVAGKASEKLPISMPASDALYRERGGNFYRVCASPA